MIRTDVNMDHVCDEKEACRPDGMNRRERVKKYERLFDEALAQPDPEKLRLLEAYYTSCEWLEDYEAY